MAEVLGLIAFGAALAYGLGYRAWPHSPLRVFVKTVPVAAMALIGWLEGAPALLVAALAFGAAGDAALALPGRTAFLAGIAAFLAGHLCTLALFLGEGGGIAALAGWRLALAALIAAAAIGLGAWLRPRLGDLAGPVTVYVGVLAATAMAAMTLPLERWPAMIGAWLFLESDSALAVETFVLADGHPAKPALGHAVWWSYVAAQALILAAWM
jgi:uncharacterized membrane protein YhhN